jgi:hypothetical protein
MNVNHASKKHAICIIIEKSHDNFRFIRILSNPNIWTLEVTANITANSVLSPKRQLISAFKLKQL